MSIWAIIHIVCIAVMLPMTIWCKDSGSRAIFAGPLLYNAVYLGVEIARLSP
jgi:hypothetical protein